LLSSIIIVVAVAVAVAVAVVGAAHEHMNHNHIHHHPSSNNDDDYYKMQCDQVSTDRNGSSSRSLAATTATAASIDVGKLQ
jgi:hypothetical protein